MINPIIFRLGIKQDWNLKFVYKKRFDLINYSFKNLEIINFIQLFFKKYGIGIDNLKIYYKCNDIKLYIIYSFITFIYEKINYKKTINQINHYNQVLSAKKLFLFNSKILTVKFYIKLKYLKKFYKQTSKNNYIFFNNLIINYIINRFSIFKFITLIKFQFMNLKQNFLINKFLNKFIISLKLFLNNKTNLIIIFKQLIKNINSKGLFIIRKQIFSLNILKLRKYSKLNSFKFFVNLIYYSLNLKKKVFNISEFLNSNFPNIKKPKFVNIFLKFIEHLFKLFFYKLNYIKGITIIFNGNFSKNKGATKSSIIIGDKLNNLKINNNLDYKELLCFTIKGTVGIKIFIKL